MKPTKIAPVKHGARRRQGLLPEPDGSAGERIRRIALNRSAEKEKPQEAIPRGEMGNIIALGAEKPVAHRD